MTLCTNITLTLILCHEIVDVVNRLVEAVHAHLPQVAR